MGIFTNDTGEQILEHTIDKNRKEIACMCWFTLSGRSFPRYISYEDEEGIRQTAEIVDILETEETNFAGSPAVMHRCTIFLHGIKAEIRLIFYYEERKWEIHY